MEAGQRFGRSTEAFSVRSEEGASLQSGSSIRNDYSPAGTACNNGIANKVYPADLIATPTVCTAPPQIGSTIFTWYFANREKLSRVPRALRVPFRAEWRGRERQDRQRAWCVSGLPREFLTRVRTNKGISTSCDSGKAIWNLRAIR